LKIRNKVGIGTLIKDDQDQGRFVLVKMEWFLSMLDVIVGETMGFLLALKSDSSELGNIISDCRCIFNFHFTNSLVEFI
jgi:hypothetical protein